MSADREPQTANLQSGGVTVKQAAEMMNVSERQVYSVRRVMRSGRQDLIEAMGRGEIRVHRALQILDGDKPKDRYVALVRAWNAVSDDERARFYLAINMGPDGEGCGE